MPRTRKDEAPIMVSEPVIEGRYVELDDWTVSFERFPIGSDPSPLFKGLPDDRCQCTHVGYVVSGEFLVNYADRSEKVRAGDAYLLTPGHLTVLADDTEVIEFTLTDELQKTMAVVGANMQAGAGVQ